MYSDAARRLQLCRPTLGYDVSSQSDGLNFVCVMVGKRAPELAAGALDLFLRQHADSNLAEVLRDCDKCLTEQELSVVVEDYRLGLAHLMKLVFGKLQQWQVLPWKLAALAHWGKEVVRATARKILA